VTYRVLSSFSLHRLPNHLLLLLSNNKNQSPSPSLCTRRPNTDQTVLRAPPTREGYRAEAWLRPPRRENRGVQHLLATRSMLSQLRRTRSASCSSGFRKRTPASTSRGPTSTGRCPTPRLSWAASRGDGRPLRRGRFVPREGFPVTCRLPTGMKPTSTPTPLPRKRKRNKALPPMEENDTQVAQLHRTML